MPFKESWKAALPPSKIFLLGCLICFFAACSSQTRNEAQVFEDSILTSQYLYKRYGKLESEPLEKYLDYLGNRVLHGSDERIDISIDVLGTLHPLAFSAGNGKVILSRGLILALHSEAELAFVIAHEISHQLLDHETTMLKEYVLNQPSATKKLEFAADTNALGLIAIAGYDPRSSIYAILHAYRGAGHPDASHTHPALESRIRHIEQRIRQSGWRPPGTVNRRQFSKIQRLLETI